MLGVVERAVTDGREDLADDEQRVAVEVVRRRAGHDDGAGEVEAGEDDGHDRAAPFVDVEAEPNAEERVHEVRDCDLLGRVRQYLLEEEDGREVGGTRVANWELLMCVSLMMVVFRDLYSRSS